MSLNYGGFESVGCVVSSADQPDRNDWTWLVECTVCFALVRSVSSREHMKWHEEGRHLRA